MLLSNKRDSATWRHGAGRLVTRELTDPVALGRDTRLLGVRLDEFAEAGADHDSDSSSVFVGVGTDCQPGCGHLRCMMGLAESGRGQSFVHGHVGPAFQIHVHSSA